MMLGQDGGRWSRGKHLLHTCEDLSLTPQSPQMAGCSSVYLQSQYSDDEMGAETEDSLKAHGPASLVYTTANNKETLPQLS